LTGVAVKFTVVPAHVVAASAVIETLTGNTGLTVIATILLVAGLPETHVKLEVMTTVILSAFARVFEL
jgi:hypothetical protein